MIARLQESRSRCAGRVSLLAVAAVVWLAVAGSAAAQVRAGGAGCPGGERAKPDLGITEFICKCSFETSDSNPGRWTFYSEPRILGVAKGGPTDGRLESGDAVVAIDGKLITTAAGGERWSTVAPGERVQLRVRREGTVRTVEITVAAKCPADEALPAEATETRHAPSLPRLLPRGWLGMGLSCQCSVNAGGEFPLWTFGDYPRVEKVAAGSPAAAAGMQVGDLLVRVNGRPLTTGAGDSAFSRIQPGDRVTFTLRRAGAERTVALNAGEWPEE